MRQKCTPIWSYILYLHLFISFRESGSSAISSTHFTKKKMWIRCTQSTVSLAVRGIDYIMHGSNNQSWRSTVDVVNQKQNQLPWPTQREKWREVFRIFFFFFKLGKLWFFFHVSWYCFRALCEYPGSCWRTVEKIDQSCESCQNLFNRGSHLFLYQNRQKPPQEYIFEFCCFHQPFSNGRLQNVHTKYAEGNT